MTTAILLRLLSWYPHGNFDCFLSGSLDRLLISSINVTRNSNTRIVCQHAVQAFRRRVSPVGHRNLSCVKRIADTDTSAVMKRNPAGSARGIQERVENRPV